MTSPLNFGPRCEEYLENIIPASKDHLEFVPNATQREIEASSEHISSKNLISHSDSVIESNKIKMGYSPTNSKKKSICISFLINNNKFYFINLP